MGISLETSQAVEEKRVNIFEMGESEQIIELPMSSEEIASEDAENARLVSLRKARFIKPQKPEAYLELAESVIIIEFSERILEVYS